ncbi:MAG TPA: MBL fold metallo-hydrolase [Opitutaceae bacterium]|nr:MBL fold metallo-hydrolase [Opitutaceae bacterium]
MVGDIGKPLPSWEEGMLDIHHINTGRGDSVFFILPDGTTMLVDASDGQANPLPAPFGMPTKPNNSRQAGEWIARYILRALQHFPEKKIDYAILSHFHGDHIGKVTADSKRAAQGDYALTGISEIPEYVPIGMIIDRNWPDYNYPAPIELDNYRQFLNWQIAHRGLVVEQFKPGHNDQVALLRNPAAYANFEIRNLIANGRVWTGKGTDTRELADLKHGQRLDENQCSIAFRLTYGKFDYFSGGDLDAKSRVLMPSSRTWQDVEPAAAMASGPVDALKANHHGSWDANCAEFLSLLQPRVIVVTSRADGHPATNTFQRMISKSLWPGPRDIFITNVTPSTHATTYNLDKAKCTQGHVVIRVDVGGATYRVYALDDNDEENRVIGVFGPYAAK